MNTPIDRTYVSVHAPKKGAVKMIYLHEYKTFANVHELNHHVKQHTNKRYHDMNETHRQVLQLLSQYSVKHAGASHLRIQTIANALDKSRRTIERAIRVLIDLDAIERLHTTRRITGGKGANIYVILPYAESNAVSNMTHCNDVEKAYGDNDTTPIVEKESANLLSTKSSYKDVCDLRDNTPPSTTQSTSPSNDTQASPYGRFTDAVSTFIDVADNGSRKLLYRLYGVYLAQSKALRKAYDAGELIDVATRAIHATFHASKRTGIRNIAGYFNGVLSNMYDGLFADTMREFFADSSNDREWIRYSADGEMLHT